MLRIKKMMAIMMLAVMAILGSQTASATVLLSDRNGVLLSDDDGKSATKDVKTLSTINIIVVFMRTGVLLSDDDG